MPPTPFPPNIVISRATAAHIAALSAAAFPAEACGLLAGRTTGGTLELVPYPTPNAARGRNAFRIPPAALTSVLQRMYRDGVVLCGCFHSHPSGPARPSPVDCRFGSRSPQFLWLIYSTTTRDLALFRQRGGSFAAVPWRRT